MTRTSGWSSRKKKKGEVVSCTTLTDSAWSFGHGQVEGKSTVLSRVYLPNMYLFMEGQEGGNVFGAQRVASLPTTYTFYY